MSVGSFTWHAGSSAVDRNFRLYELAVAARRRQQTPLRSLTAKLGESADIVVGLAGTAAVLASESPKGKLHHPVIVQLEDVTVSFNGFKALNQVNFYVDRGELRFLIGPNGAGKTTLLDVICKKVTPTHGTVLFDGNTELNRLSVPKIAQLGVARKFQAPSIFSNQTVVGNMELAYPRSQGVFSSLRHKTSTTERDEIDEVLNLVGLLDLRKKRAADLSHGQKQWLELAMTIIQGPKLLLVDEPVAGMSASERVRTGEILTKVAEKCSVLVVEHDMHFVKSFSKRVTVLHEGRILCDGDFNTVSKDEQVIDVYLGRGRKD